MSPMPEKYDPAQAFEDLKSKDAKVRKGGATWIQKHAYAAVNKWAEVWLTDPKTTRALIPLLEDPDPEVAEKAISAISGIVSRYHQDARVLPGAVSLMQSERRNSRRDAALVVMKVGGEKYLDRLIQKFADPDKAVRALIIARIREFCESGRQMSDATQPISWLS